MRGSIKGAWDGRSRAMGRGLERLWGAGVCGGRRNKGRPEAGVTSGETDNSKSCGGVAKPELRETNSRLFWEQWGN
jgi:hypothetical protein